MKNYEKILADSLVHVKYESLKQKDIEAVKKMLLAVFCGIIAGWDSNGCRECWELETEAGGKEEATVLIRGGKIPAERAAFVNAVMARAMDIGDHIAPGMQIGSAVIPAALAAAELTGKCSGKDLILAIAVGTDLALRLNVSDGDYDGLDPTGHDAVFAAAAAAAKLMDLNEKQMQNTLALAFNRGCGSFQSNVDGSLAVRVIEGWTAQSGVECAKLAARNITGPQNFLKGVFGYAHVIGKDHMDLEAVTAGFGENWRMDTVSFKKYPCCGQTQGSTELLLDLMEKNKIRTEEIDVINVILNSFTYKLVGKEFEIGDNPKVDAQFNAGYCVANAALRKPVVLKHFEPEYIQNEEVLRFLKDHVRVVMDEKLHDRGHYSSDMEILLKDGRKFAGSIDIPPGSIGNELKEEDFIARFRDCVDFADLPVIRENAERIFEALQNFEKIGDIRSFVDLFRTDPLES